jgi:hypothetical protein
MTITELYQFIDQYINTKEGSDRITGATDNMVRKVVIENLIRICSTGFGGELAKNTNPGTLNSPTYFLAKETGSYTYCQGVTVSSLPSFIVFNGSQWSVLEFNIVAEIIAPESQSKGIVTASSQAPISPALKDWYMFVGAGTLNWPGDIKNRPGIVYCSSVSPVTWSIQKLYEEAGPSVITETQTFQPRSKWRMKGNVIVKEIPAEGVIEFDFAGDSQVINVEDAALFDENKNGGYKEGAIVSFRVEGSSEPPFDAFAIYVAEADIPKGIAPNSLAPENKWSYQGSKYEQFDSRTSLVSISGGSSPIAAIKGYREGDGITDHTTGIHYIFRTNATQGIKPLDVDSSSPGRWVETAVFAKGKRVQTISHNNSNPVNMFWHNNYNITVADSIEELTLNIEFNSSFSNETTAVCSAYINNNNNSKDVALQFSFPGNHGAIRWINSITPSMLLANTGYILKLERIATNLYLGEFLLLDKEAESKSLVKTYTIDFQTTSELAIDINMFSDSTINRIETLNVGSILLTYSGGIAQAVTPGEVNIDIVQYDKLIWEISRNEADVPAAIAIFLTLKD